MANTKSASKRARQTTRRTATNRRTLVKSRLKGAREALAGADKAKAKAAAVAVVSSLDKAAKAGRIHRNAANRHKSRLAKALAKAA